MCLYTRNSKPLIAKQDIVCLKYLCQWGDGSYHTPYQKTTVELNANLAPTSKSVDIREIGVDYFNNKIFEINGGVIHARIMPGGVPGKSFKAIIKKGTEYYIHPFGSEISAKKIFITDKEGTLEDTMSFWEDVLSRAPSSGLLHVGDLILKNGESVRPCRDLDKSIVIGRVVGFHEERPLIASVDETSRGWGPYEKVTSLLDREDAVHSYNGLENTKEFLKRTDRKRFPAYDYCANFRKSEGETWYFPALGEMMEMLNNALYLRASFYISGIGSDLSGWYHSSSEVGVYDSWYCRLYGFQVYCGWCLKDFQYRIVPFLASLGINEEDEE
jgi:hypothetical protein